MEKSGLLQLTLGWTTICGAPPAVTELPGALGCPRSCRALMLSTGPCGLLVSVGPLQVECQPWGVVLTEFSSPIPPFTCLLPRGAVPASPYPGLGKTEKGWAGKEGVALPVRGRQGPS